MSIDVKDSIKRAAVDLCINRVAQVLQAAITHLEHAKQVQLGCPGVTRIECPEADAEGESLAFSMLIALAESLPMQPKSAVIACDTDRVLRCGELDVLQCEVQEEVFKQMGVNDGDA